MNCFFPPFGCRDIFNSASYRLCQDETRSSCHEFWLERLEESQAYSPADLTLVAECFLFLLSWCLADDIKDLAFCVPLLRTRLLVCEREESPQIRDDCGVWRRMIVWRAIFDDQGCRFTRPLVPVLSRVSVMYTCIKSGAAIMSGVGIRVDITISSAQHSTSKTE